MKKYFSQYGQDEFIDKVVLNKKRNGFFVDIGAHDGISYSNSNFFELYRGFTGLCIEPNPKVFELLQKNRNCTILNACIADKVGTVNFLAIEGYSEMLSGIIDHYHPRHLERIEDYIAMHGGNKREIDVNCTPLQNIALLQNKTIDFISIDTEGNELSILKSIDFSKIEVLCFSIENNYEENGIEEIMNKNGYIKVHHLGDDIYLLKNKYTTAFKIRKEFYRYVSKIKKILHF